MRHPHNPRHSFPQFELLAPEYLSIEYRNRTRKTKKIENSLDRVVFLTLALFAAVVASGCFICTTVLFAGESTKPIRAVGDFALLILPAVLGSFAVAALTAIALSIVWARARTADDDWARSVNAARTARDTTVPEHDQEEPHDSEG